MIKVKNAYQHFSLGYSRKGWTNRTICVEYAKDFDAQTKQIARGRTRVLWLDSHDSHVTYEFLQYCVDHKIKIAAYPKHATHVYQLLDVVLFAPLKHEYGRLRDELLRTTGEAITKQNFLKIYGQAHLNILTEDLIKTGYRKVGIIPVNRNVVTPEMMAPSKDTSFKVFTPVIPSTPIRIVSDLIMDVIQPHESEERPQKIPPFPVRVAVPLLAQTELAFLVSKTPIKASTPLPDMPEIIISPIKHRRAEKRTTAWEPETLQEAKEELQREKAMNAEMKEELRLERAKNMEIKGIALQTQAQNVINRIYCGRLRGQLAATEKKKDKKDDGGMLDEDLPPLLTHEDFIKHVKERQEATAAAKKKREGNKDRRIAYKEEMVIWKAAEMARKERNMKREGDRIEAEAAWMAEKAEIKSKRGRVKEWEATHPKPKKNDPEWKPEAAIPKPKLYQKVAKDVEDSSGDEFDLDMASEDDDEE
jgi:hypothetical protein